MVCCNVTILSLNITGLIGSRQSTTPMKESTLPPGSTSRLAKHTVLPPISSPPPTGVSTSRLSQDDPAKNPFVMPPTSEVFTLRERERQRMKHERTKERLLKVHEKSTYSSRLNTKMASLRKQTLTPDSLTTEGRSKEASIHEDTQFVLATTKDRHIEKEDLVTYVGRKREMFLVQYALGVKREEIMKLEDIAKVSLYVIYSGTYIPDITAARGVCDRGAIKQFIRL